MMEVETISYAVGFVGLLAGVGISLQLIGSTDSKANSGAFGYLLVIPGFASLAYLGMAIDIGTIVIDGYALPTLRYVDWLVTTPVLVGYAGYVAGADKQWYLGAGVIDGLMIVFGFGAAVLDPPLRWGAFALSAACHLGLLVVLYRIFPTYAGDRNSTRQQLFRKLQNHVGLLWLAYPVVWVVSPLGIGIISGLAVAMIIAFMDLIAKTPYVYFVYTHRDAFAAEDSFTETETVPEPATDGESSPVAGD